MFCYMIDYGMWVEMTQCYLTALEAIAEGFKVSYTVRRGEYDIS